LEWIALRHGDLRRVVEHGSFAKAGSGSTFRPRCSTRGRLETHLMCACSTHDAAAEPHGETDRRSTTRACKCSQMEEAKQAARCSAARPAGRSAVMRDQLRRASRRAAGRCVRRTPSRGPVRRAALRHASWISSRRASTSRSASARCRRRTDRAQAGRDRSCPAPRRCTCASTARGTPVDSSSTHA